MQKLRPKRQCCRAERDGMNSRGIALQKSRNIEDLHELRLMALLHDLVRKHERKGAGQMLGVDARTVGTCLTRERCQNGCGMRWRGCSWPGSPKRWPNKRSASRPVRNGFKGVREAVQGEIRALRDEHAKALRQLEQRLVRLEARPDVQGTAEPFSNSKQPVGSTKSWRRYPELGVVPRDVVYSREAGVAPSMPPCGRR